MSVAAIADEIASIHSYFDSIGDDAHDPSIRANVLNSLITMIANVRGGISMSDAAKLASAISAAPLTAKEAREIHTAVHSQLSTSVICSTGSAGQSFGSPMSVSNILPQWLWDYLLDCTVPWELKCQSVVDFLGRGELTKPNELARADVIALTAACHFRGVAVKVPSQTFLYEAVHSIKPSFDNVRPLARALLVWPLTAAEFPALCTRPCIPADRPSSARSLSPN